MWWLLPLLCIAQDAVPDGAIVLQTSAGAQVELFPRMKADTIELVVHNNNKPLDQQLDGQRTASVDDSWAASTGSGTWFVTLYVNDPSTTAVLTQEGKTQWVIETRRGARPAPLVPEPVATIDDLFQDRVLRRPARPPAMPLRPLGGDAWTARLDPTEVRLPVDAWTPRLDGVPRGTPTMSDIDSVRLTMAAATNAKDKTAAFQHLALMHQRLGLHREARAYFNRVADQPTEWPRATVRLHQADAALATGRWDEARTHCTNAYKGGAEPDVALGCLGRVAIATGSPAPTETARALLREDTGPESKLVAAQLLLIDHRAEEALPLLQGTQDWPMSLQRWRDATLGDAALAVRDLETARRAWRDVGTRGELGDVAKQRARLIRMLDDAPSKWAEEAPAIAKDGRGRSPAAAEAHYLAAQVGEAFDDAGMAAEHLTELIDRWPDLSAGSDIPHRLLHQCDRRIGQLHRAGRTVAIAAFYHDCWRPQINAITHDTTPLQRSAQAMAYLGLWDQALFIQRDVASILTRDDREDVDVLADLAQMYDRVGRHAEALETVQYAMKRSPTPTQRAKLYLASGDAHASMGSSDQALAAWSRAEADPTLRAETQARRTLLLADLGRCKETLPLLNALSENGDASN
ncbi:MAG: hypothetical protein AB8H79_16465 [Myxococcota bacterium]